MSLKGLIVAAYPAPILFSSAAVIEPSDLPSASTSRHPIHFPVLRVTQLEAGGDTHCAPGILAILASA